MIQTIEVKMPVQFLSAGQFNARSGWVHPRRCCDSNVFFMVESGRFTICQGQYRYDLGPHEALLLLAGQEHYGLHLENNQDPVYYWAHFTSAGGDPLLVPQHVRLNNYDKMSVFFHQLISESRGNAPIALVCDYLMSIMLLHAADAGQQARDGDMLYLRLQEYLRMNYRRKVTLEELTEKFHYSGDYLSRLFKKNTGMSFKHYLHTLRLEEAKQRLISSVDSVKQIGNLCGYTNEQFFITTFIKYEGLSPTQYRNAFGRFHQNDR